MQLIPHPDWPASAIEAIEVDARFAAAAAVLSYRVRGPGPLLPAPAAAERADDLWRHTCFELFIGVGGEGYYEFNFSPSTQWAAYRFEGYREGRSDVTLAAPAIERLADGVRVTVDLSALPSGEWRIGLSAVIEEADGTMSYWALAHPPGKADFHDPVCLALEFTS
jgi:hypothetical protein